MSSYLVNDPANVPEFDPLQYASDYVRAYCNQQFDYVEDEVILIDPWPNASAWLPEWPVISVSKVESWALSAEGVLGWSELSTYAWTSDGMLYDTSQVAIGTGSAVWPSWPRLPKSLRVTYTHGHQTIPSDLESVVLRIAGDIEENPYGVHAERVGEVSTVYDNASVMQGNVHVTLRDQDKAILDRYSRVGLS